MQSSVSCDIILDPKRIKFFEVGISGPGFYLSKKVFSFVKKCKFKKPPLIMMSS